jgi:tetratricopeptide (TPR) repeat protein
MMGYHGRPGPVTVPRRAPVFCLLLFTAFAAALAAAFATACSSAPKRPAEVFSVRNMTETQLELANKETDRGHYETALELLAEARRLAVSADDPKLLIRTGLSEGNILFYLGRGEEAQRAWAAALAEAEAAREEELAAVSRIFMARSRLISPSGETPGDGAGEVRAQVQNEMSKIKSRSYTALGWTVTGLAEKALGRWDDAESSINKALDIHKKDNYLEQAAYDWYLIASVRSVAGQYAAAREALEEALAYDRRAENTYGLGMDWLALGDVLTKAGDTAGAETAYRRSAEIFRSIGLENEAAETAGRLK